MSILFMNVKIDTLRKYLQNNIRDIPYCDWSNIAIVFINVCEILFTLTNSLPQHLGAYFLNVRLGLNVIA